MNKRGTLFFAVLLAVFIFAAGMLMMNFLKDDVSNTRISLSCSDVTISDGAKLVCLGLDIIPTYWFWLLLSIGGSLIADRLTL